MSLCIPCAKEIIDNRAQAALTTLHSLAHALPGMVERGQLTGAVAAEHLEAMMEVEANFYISAELLAQAIAESAVSPWEVGASGAAAIV